MIRLVFLIINIIHQFHFIRGDVGLDIGAMTSQFLAIYYLNGLDHYIKENLCCLYYIKYMDDLIILDNDINKLKDIFSKIEKKVIALGLKINSKSSIRKLSDGINFLGYRYIIDGNNKLNIRYSKKTIKKINKKLKILKEKDRLKYFRSYSSYYGYLSKIRNYERIFSMKSIEKYDYYKRINPKSIIFIKDGNLYKTFRDDAVIIWYLFGYKIINNSIVLKVSAYSRVIDRLNRLELSYVVIDEKEINISNSDDVYNLYLMLSTIKYKKIFKLL